MPNHEHVLFVGYEQSAGIYRLIEPAVNYRLVESREVTFFEDESGAKLCHQEMARATESSDADVFLPLLQSETEDNMAQPQQTGCS